MNLVSDLHNNHNVYILGAGFSKLRGLPLVANFMNQMRDALEYHAHLGHRSECDAINAVLNFRLKASSAAYRVQVDLENIEDLFSLASASPNPIEESIRLAIAATLDYSLNIHPKKIATFTATSDAFHNNPNWTKSSFSATESRWKVPAYEYIAETLLGTNKSSGIGIENTFITFNYDTILEESLKSLNVGYTLGFNETKHPRNKSETRVLKLHGSMNWAIPKGARTTINIFNSYREVVDAGLTPMLIPPTWKKDSRGDFNLIWREALKALSGATRVVVIGFSIPPTDMHFKYLLAAGLQDNFSLREIVFVNPGEGLKQVSKRCEHLFANIEHNAAKVRFVDSTAEDFMGQGTVNSRCYSISRPLPESLQNLSYSDR